MENMAESPEVSWRSQSFRQNVIAKIEEAIRQSGNPTTKSVAEMETHVFQKAKSREEYLGFVARLIIHVREMKSLELVDDPVCDPTITLSIPLRLPSPVETPLETNSPSRTKAGPSTPLPVSHPTENLESPPSSGSSANWLKRKRRPNDSVRSAEALNAATKTVEERESLQRMAHAEKEHEMRMVVMEEKVLTLREKGLMLRAKREYYERGNKN